MKEELAALYALQLQDSALDALKRQFALLDSGKVEKEAFDKADAAKKAASTDVNKTGADIKDAELEQQQVHTKRKDYETRLYSGKVTNPKELVAMQDEVDMLSRQLTRLDDKIIALANSLDDKQKLLAEAADARKSAASVYNAKVKSYTEIAEKIRAQAQELVNGRKPLVDAVQPALLKKYDAMRATKGGVAIVALEDGNACGGCKMALPSNIIKRLKEGSELQYCQNCGRMLCEAPKK